MRSEDAGRAGAVADHAGVGRRVWPPSRSDDRGDRCEADRTSQSDHASRGLPALESAWRGLHYLVNNTETDETLKIKVFNISKKELGRTLKKFRGTAWDQSPIFKKIYEEEFGQFGGEPFGRWWVTTTSTTARRTCSLLQDMAQVAAAAHAPFMAAAAPTVMQMDSWNELSNPRDLTKIFQTPEYAAWRSLREIEDSRYLGLCMPRFLARLALRRQDRTGRGVCLRGRYRRAGERASYAWSNSCLCDGDEHHPRLQAVRLDVEHPRHRKRWCGRRPAGAYLPHDDGGVAMKCPTEIAISDRREAELAKNGFMPLIHKKNSDFAAFIGAQSLQKPRNTTIRLRRRTPTSRHVCRTSSRAAASRTT